MDASKINKKVGGGHLLLINFGEEVMLSASGPVQKEQDNGKECVNEVRA